MVWLHHFFTMGAGADVNAFFGIMSIDHRGADRASKSSTGCSRCSAAAIVFTTPVLFAVGFMVTFVIGGMTGVSAGGAAGRFRAAQQRLPGRPFPQCHHRRRRVRRAGRLQLLVPEGVRLHPRRTAGQGQLLVLAHRLLSRLHAALCAGADGHDPAAAAHPRPELAAAAAGRGVRGAIVIFCGILCQIAQLYVSIRTRERRRDLTGDPWNGRTLEWATSSPPPAYNFAVLPEVETIDAFWDMKRTRRRPAEPAYEAIEMPRNSPAGFITAFFAVVTGFALIWHIWWMAILGFLAAAVAVLMLGWSDRARARNPGRRSRANGASPVRLRQPA